MPIALVADAHIGGPGGPAAPLVAQLDALDRDTCEQLILMGDLFHVWIGDLRYETPEIAEVVAALRRVRGRGVAVHYIEGNRDFFLAQSPYADAFDAVHLEYQVATLGRQFFFVHGDGLNDRDLQYRFWRWLSKSAPSRFFVRRIPGPLARRIVNSTEQRLSRSNFKHKAQLPIAAIRRFAADKLCSEADVLVLGHFHEPRQLTLSTGGGAEGQSPRSQSLSPQACGTEASGEGEVWLLDAWFRHREMRWLGVSGEVAEADRVDGALDEASER